MNNPPKGNKDSALLVAVNVVGETVLVKKMNHRSPLLRIAGGTVEECETPLSALKREIEEETGMNIESYKVHFLFSEWNDMHQHYYHVFGAIMSKFSGLHGRPVLDGHDLLGVEVHEISSGLKQKMVPQHGVMFEKAVNIIAEKYA